ncbi:hypothetical protein A3D78_03280 [Candidatus Gottesmanbacteria bacterium RIFCSPHIGHO2_02_FULL_39_14]|uniref:Uncharacterized protein n=2 Tax=Candidatus Gottesmaniibacteriota TaxID=1752720 RepID=A0A1F5ZUZ0_9BACT|nr:MAG: hypothetical protein A3D78_03280 [Candidatus Gottesmanbacteria bacterium RIFCSPHIGHO2_02_FULL_39_14]OGG31099.1 MAG: hypothetical protein A3I51_05680 [Candidatus Gottesmanbacteria bacterium RIFCSPLOWO2_02_FULL_38_8]
MHYTGRTLKSVKIIREDQNSLVLKDNNLIAFFAGIVFALSGIQIIFNPSKSINSIPIWSGID